CGPRRSDHGTGAGYREDQRSGAAAGDRQGADHGQSRRMDCSACPRGSGAGAAARSGRFSGQAGAEPNRPSRGLRSYLAAGHDALLTGDDSPMNGLLAEILVSVPATSIAGGTDEIQRNIISERVLKMPRERTGDTDKPFKDVPRNTVA